MSTNQFKKAFTPVRAFTGFNENGEKTFETHLNYPTTDTPFARLLGEETSAPTTPSRKKPARPNKIKPPAKIVRKKEEPAQAVEVFTSIEPRRIVFSKPETEFQRRMFRQYGMTGWEVVAVSNHGHRMIRRAGFNKLSFRIVVNFDQLTEIPNDPEPVVIVNPNDHPLRQFIRKTGLTQREFCKTFGWDEKKVSAVINGKAAFADMFPLGIDAGNFGSFFL
jgi:hypothetical protein